MQTKKLIVLEGNIGAGKSTLLRLIQEQLPVSIIAEPTDKWQTVAHDENLLDLFYKDTPRWAYTFQSYAFLTRIQSIMEHMAKHQDGGTFILERSVYCDRFCFAKNCYEAGFMTPLEWNIYKDWFAWLVESNHAPKPSGFIYLRVEPDIAYDRIQKRNRSEETGISKGYLQSLHDKHDDWLVHQKEPCSSIKQVPVLTLNCNDEFEQSLEKQQEHLARVAAFIEQLGQTAHRQPTATAYATPV
jgi:deoxyadenosine/deoxycytidine kinase